MLGANMLRPANLKKNLTKKITGRKKKSTKCRVNLLEVV